MELLSIILSGLLALASPVGFIFDNIAERDIRSALYSAEELEVRLDNSPNYFLLGGKIERLRFAGRGLYVTPELRIDTFELETDPILVDRDRLNREDENSIPRFLKQPLQGAVRLVITEEDINQALRSPTVVEQLRELGIGLAPNTAADDDSQRYEIVNPQIEFLGNNRLRFQFAIEDRRENDTVSVVLETGLEVVAGSQLRPLDPKILINDQEAPNRLVTILSRVVNRILNLKKFQDEGLLARVLQFTITPEQLEVAAFVRIEPPARVSRASDR